MRLTSLSDLMPRSRYQIKSTPWQATGVPKILHQSARNFSGLDPDIQKNIADFQSMNPEWEYKFYNDNDVRHYIRAQYGQNIYDLWTRISPSYGAARADLFRYLLLFQKGGVWLDIKSTASKPLSQVITADDQFILSQWPTDPAHRYGSWGKYPELAHVPGGEYQQWFIVSAPGHPFLRAVINGVLRQLRNYDPQRDGVGKPPTMRTTGPIIYTIEIHKILEDYPYRMADYATDLGFSYSIFHDRGSGSHITKVGNHYSKAEDPLMISRRRWVAEKLLRRMKRIGNWAK